MRRARQASTARAMNVEERYAVSLAQGTAFGIGERASYGIKRAGRHVSWNDRVRHTRQAPVPQVHVRAAHL